MHCRPMLQIEANVCFAVQSTVQYCHGLGAASHDEFYSKAMNT